MKYFLLSLLMMALLCGCGQTQTMETLGDTLDAPVLAQPREVAVDLPGEAAIPTMEEEGRRYYLCKDYEITLDRRESGDLRQTIRDLSGYEPEDLTVVSTQAPGARRYDFVWTSAGEQGERLGRAAVLDDGNYHYTLSVLRDADTTESLQVVWRQVFSSFQLS